MSMTSAIEEFNRARRKAMLQQFLARFTGRSADLLSYEEVRRSLQANQQIQRGLQNVPLDAIVGSVGRYRDFTRTFLPKESTNQERWARILLENTEGTGLPPVELYKIGEAYFVSDGNHRVSVARELEMGTIEAYVTEVESKIPFTLDAGPDKLLIAQQYITFVEATDINRLRPEADLQVTVPGKYRLLIEHIEVHHYFMGIDQQREIAWPEAVAHWYDEVYLPMVALIQEKGVMHDFPQRTETDFYIWLAEHRIELKNALGWEVSTLQAVDSLTEAKRPLLTRVNDRIWESLGGEEEISLATRKQWQIIKRAGEESNSERVFENIMVTIDGRAVDWTALKQALIIAQQEQSQIHALYFPEDSAQTEQDEVKNHFQQILQKAGLSGQIAVVDGNWQSHMLERAHWNDLVILGLGEYDSGLRQRPWRQIAIQSPRPVLLVSDETSPLQKILLAYDGKKYATQALAISTYLAAQWGATITILIIGDKTHFNRLHEQVDTYLAPHKVAATFVNHTSDVAINLLLTAEREGCDLVIMGTYSHTPILEMVRGTAVNTMLRNAKRPILICQ